METYIRLKPPLVSTEGTRFITALDQHRIEVNAPESSHSFRCSNERTRATVSFSRVLDDCASQAEVFTGVGIPKVERLLSGEDGILLAMGVTGSGKSHTLLGGNTNEGLVQQCLDYIFNATKSSSETVLDDPLGLLTSEPGATDSKVEVHKLYPRMSAILSPLQIRKRSDASTGDDHPNLSTFAGSEVRVSFVELYNDKFRDLLEDQSIKARPLTLKKDANSKKYIAGRKECLVRNLPEAVELINIGRSRRQVFSTKANSSSSRSHAIFIISVHKVGIARNSELTIVDLAGSERCKTTGTSGIHLQEAGNINLSLMALGQCLSALRSGNPSRNSLFPSRQSKLTEFLFESKFFDQEKPNVGMLVCIDPTAFYDENVQILKYASDAREAKTLMKMARAPSRTESQNSRREVVPSASMDIHEDNPMVDDGNPSEDVTETIAELKEQVSYWQAEYTSVVETVQTLEQEIREEMSSMMESTITDLERRHRVQLEEQRDRAQDSTDRKITFLQHARLHQKATVGTRTHGSGDAADVEASVARLELENRLLRAENQRLRMEKRASVLQARMSGQENFEEQVKKLDIRDAEA